MGLSDERKEKIINHLQEDWGVDPAGVLQEFARLEQPDVKEPWRLTKLAKAEYNSVKGAFLRGVFVCVTTSPAASLFGSPPFCAYVRQPLLPLLLQVCLFPTSTAFVSSCLCN